MAWAAIGVAISAAAVGVGISQANAAANAQPNLASSSKELSDTNAALLPLQRQIESAAQQGISTTIQNFPAHTDTQEMVLVPQFVTETNARGVEHQRKTMPLSVPLTEWTEPGGKYYGQTVPGKIVKKTVKVPAGPKTFDFTGYGKADVESKLADARAKLGLDISKKYDSQFINEALKQEAEADPEGVAARAEMNKLIQGQIDRNPDRPVADMLDAQVSESLAAAGTHGLSNPDQARLDAAVAEALAARGGAGGGGTDFSTPLTTGFAGEARDAGARMSAMGWLASGATPEDTAYRREQQNLANLSAQVNGKTPQSQFSSLSGAQQGPAPVTGGSPLPVLNPNNDAAARANALQNWQTQMHANAGQVNPWMQGLSAAIGAAGAAGQAGWKPFQQN